ncbi:MAG: hypothetical protein L6R38_005217 [Xanthoria sp. 2 TBL-2021]|nr:MAG: hypothetical protein L6R38_005217 [Xanthoria sp. 2 TBL-2021]
MAAKVLKMKMWPDDAGGTKGCKPDFHGAAGGEQARELYDHFVTKVQEMYEKEKVKNGVFQAMMQEIQTNPSSAQEKGNAKTAPKAGGESEYQLPAELLQ